MHKSENLDERDLFFEKHKLSFCVCVGWFPFITILCFTKLDSGQALRSNKASPNTAAHLTDSDFSEKKAAKSWPNSQGAQKQCE